MRTAATPCAPTVDPDTGVWAAARGSEAGSHSPGLAAAGEGRVSALMGQGEASEPPGAAAHPSQVSTCSPRAMWADAANLLLPAASRGLSICASAVGDVGTTGSPGLYWQKRSPLAGVLLQLGGSLGVGGQGHSQISMLSSTMLGWEVQEESSFL